MKIPSEPEPQLHTCCMRVFVAVYQPEHRRGGAVRTGGGGGESEGLVIADL